MDVQRTAKPNPLDSICDRLTILEGVHLQNLVMASPLQNPTQPYLTARKLTNPMRSTEFDDKPNYSLNLVRSH